MGVGPEPGPDPIGRGRGLHLVPGPGGEAQLSLAGGRGLSQPYSGERGTWPHVGVWGEGEEGRGCGLALIWHMGLGI